VRSRIGAAESTDTTNVIADVSRRVDYFVSQIDDDKLGHL
jgi:hypothetical protein